VGSDGLSSSTEESLNENHSQVSAIDERTGESLFQIKPRGHAQARRKKRHSLLITKPLVQGSLDVGALPFRPLESVDHHPALRPGKVSFLMDAAVGFLNINQHMIITIFPVASIALTEGEWLR